MGSLNAGPGAGLMWEHLSTIVTIASFILTAGGMLVAVTWRLSRTEIALREAITEAKDETEAEQRKQAREFSERTERMTREFGEGLAALRQKVHDTETWNRDNFVRKDSFEKGLTRIETAMAEQRKDFRDWMEKLEKKFDGAST